MEPIKLPLLSSKVSPKTSKELLDYLLAHALASDFSQSIYFHGKVTSIAYIVAKYGSDVTRLITSMQDKLTTYLEPYFATPVVSVSEMPIPGLDPKGNRYGLQITITVIDDEGKRVNAAEGILVDGSVMERLGRQT